MFVAINVRKVFAKFVTPLMSKPGGRGGGVEPGNFLLFLIVGFLLEVISNCRFGFLCMEGMLALNMRTFLALELVDRLLLMLYGRFLIIEVGWLLCL